MDVKTVIERIEEVLKEHSMPKRVRNTLEEVKADLGSDGQDSAVQITSAIYALDEVSNDVNIPMHTKTVLWDITGMLEGLKEA